MMLDAPLDIITESPLWQDDLIQPLRQHGISAYQFLLPHHSDKSASPFSLVLADDSLIQELNAEWREKNAPTNVLAFPALPSPLPLPQSMDEQTLGDVIIAYETAQKEAEGLNVPLIEHSTHLMIHGLLHLLGHDHMNDAERLVMEDWEIRTLAELGYRNPYI